MESEIEDAIVSIGRAIQIALKKLKEGRCEQDPDELIQKLTSKIDTLRTVRKTLEDLALM